MSNLISDNQRSTAQEPEVEQPPIPKPPRSLQEFDPSSQLVELEEQKQTDASTSFAVGESIEFVAPQQENVVGLTDYFGDKLGSGGVQVQIPQVPAASTPPMINLWKDATVDLGIPNLADQRLVTTASPRPYADPLTYGSQFGSTETFVQGAAANARADAQEQANRTAAIAKAAQDFQNARGNLPNTPDASKPWHEQLWGWAGDVLQGTERERAEEERTGKGTFGAYGSGLGGFFKSVFGVPIAAATATYLETWGRDEYNMQKRLLRSGNPTVRTERITADGKRMSVEAPFNSLSDEEKHKYLTEVVSNRLPLGTGALVRTNVDFRKAFGTYIYDAFAGNVNDSINEANPKLAPVIDKRTGKPAVAKPARGLLQSANLRPGQEWYEDGGGTALEIATQLFSPGNKVDAAGELLGLGFKLLGRTNVAKQAGQALVNAVPKPLKQGATAVAGAGKRTAQAIKQGNFGSKPSVAPISQPTQVVGLPQNRGADFEAYIRNKPPVVPNVPAFNPKQTPFAPKTDPEGLAVVVGIGQKGQPLTFEPSVGLRTHQELVEQVLSQNPERFGTYKGTTWEEWEQWKKTNLGEEDLRQLEAVGAELMPPRVQMGATRESSLGSPSTNELNPPRVQQEARLQGGELAPLANEASELAPPRVQMTATLDDLQTQQRLLVEQKLSLEAPLKQLEETFDELVDVGRREIDELPLRALTEADVQKAIDYSAGVRLSRQLPPAIVETAARGDWQAFLNQAEIFGGVQALLQKNNAALEDLSSLVQVPATSKIALALPPTVYHGTALEQWQPYNLAEFGSRGELGSALYTTRSYEEAAAYSQATVGNNRSVEIAYEPLMPQVLEFSTASLKSPLDANATFELDEIAEMLGAVRFKDDFEAAVDNYTDEWGTSLTYKNAIEIAEIAVAKSGGSEELMQQVNNSVADVLRSKGYDSIYDPDSGWLAVIDNGKLDVVKQTYTNEPSAVQAAVARYNADSIAAGAYPAHATSDANLRDSTYQLLDTARNQLDERLEEVQQKLAEATSKDEPVPTSTTAKALGYDELRARAKEPPSVERYVRDIQEFGQPLHPVLVRQRSLNGRSNKITYEVYGNPEAYDAAVMNFGTTYRQVLAVVEGEGVQLVDILSIQKKTFSQTPLPSTKEQALAAFDKRTPKVAPSPVVLEETNLGVLRVLDKGYTANAYRQLKQKQVPAVVVGLDGRATAQFVDLSRVEKKAKALEPEVPKLEEAIQKPLPPVADTGKPLTSFSMKELRELGNSLGVKGNSKEKLIQRIEEAQAKAKAPKWTGLSPDRQKTLHKRLEQESVIERLVVEPNESLSNLWFEKANEIGLKGNSTNWSIPALSGAARVIAAETYLSGVVQKAKDFNFEQDVMAYANQLLQKPSLFSVASNELKQDLDKLVLTTAKQTVDKLVKEEPAFVKALLKRKSKREVELNSFATYAKIRLEAGEDEADAFLATTLVDFYKRKKADTVASETKPTAIDNIESTLDEYDELERSFNAEIEEAKRALNPHPNLREALDSTVDDSPNICKF